MGISSSSNSTSSATTPPKVVFFDGVCNLCNGFVDFVTKHDSSFFFSPLQGKAFENLHTELPPEAKGLQTIIYWSGGKLLWKSDAVFQILWDMGGAWKMAVSLRFFPRFIRDAVYDFVARHRYGWFGQKKFCRVPTPAERTRFLD